MKHGCITLFEFNVYISLKNCAKVQYCQHYIYRMNKTEI